MFLKSCLILTAGGAQFGLAGEAGRATSKLGSQKGTTGRKSGHKKARRRSRTGRAQIHSKVGMALTVFFFILAACH